MLSVVSSIYDPLGIVAPFCLLPKLLIQELCKQNYDWDQPIPLEIEKAWSKWLKDLSKLSSLWLPRCIVPETFPEITQRDLHYFCDASSTAYGAVCFARFAGDDDNPVHCSFLVGKSRVAPIKAVTVPRLELCAAVLAARLHSIVSKEMKMEFSSVTFWSDSSIVLQYLNNKDKRFKTFVSNRLRLINDVSKPSQWRHVDGKLNAADDATRGLNSREMLNNCRWLHGPKFLWQSAEEWPINAFSQIPENTMELVQPKLQTNCIVKENEPSSVLLNYFSDYMKTLKSVAWFNRFAVALSSKDNVMCGPLLSSELELALHCIIKYIQRNHFSEVLNNFEDIKSLPRHLAKLRPFVHDDGLMRVGGRLSKAPINYNSKYPVILPKACHFTTLIIQNAHVKYGHVGPQHTWTILRESYWIVNGGSEVRKAIGKCFKCKRRNASPSSQLMSDLPSCRVTPDKPPFYETGLDFFGPFNAKQARSQVKRYGCLFTCLASRAIHLELANSLETSSFVNVLRRFICRRGAPNVIWCDNGTNFVGGRAALDKAFSECSQSIWSTFLQSNMITWKFIPPTASHMGGSWERLVRSIKRVLDNLLNSQIIKVDELETLILEVENILNSRPLTPISIDPRDGEPLTPNHLIRLNATANFPPGIYNPSDMYRHNRWRQVQYLAEQFWYRWIKEYLPSLQPRQKWVKPKPNVKVADLALVVDNRFPRGIWPLGRITAIFPDKMVMSDRRMLNLKAPYIAEL